MLNLGNIFDDVLFRSGKDKIGGYITPDDFNIAWGPINQLYLTYLVNQFEQTKQLSSDLRTLIKTRGNDLYPPITLNSYGRGEIPEDYRYHARSQYTQWVNTHCSATSQYREVIFVSQAEFANRMSTEIYWPDETEPIVCFETDDTFLVRPIMPKFSLTYIRMAVTPYFDYDIISGIPVYLPPGEKHSNSTVEPQGSLSLSVEPEYPQEAYPKLSIIMTAYFAIGNRSAFNVETIRTLLESTAA
jgi:hypothetical protein